MGFFQRRAERRAAGELGALGGGLANLWSVITPWQSNWEEAAGLDGTWGSGEYSGGNTGDSFARIGGYELGGPNITPTSNTLDTGVGLTAPDGTPGDSPWAEGTEEYNAGRAEAAARMAPLITQLQGINTDFPTFTEWMDTQNLDRNSPGQAGYTNEAGEWVPGTGLYGLIEGLSGELGGLSADSDEARAYQASLAGFTDSEDGTAWEQLQSFKQGLLSKAEAAYTQSGEGALDPTQERSARRLAADMETKAQRLIADSYSESGSLGKMMLKADESLNGIANQEIQYRAQMIAENKNVAMRQYDATMNNYNTQLQQGNISATDYNNVKRQALGAAIEGYSVEMDALFQENDQYFKEYAADHQALVASVTATFAAITQEMGLIMTEYGIASDIMAGLLAGQMSDLELEQLEKEMGPDWSGVITAITGVVQLIGALSDFEIFDGIFSGGDSVGPPDTQSPENW